MRSCCWPFEACVGIFSLFTSLVLLFEMLPFVVVLLLDVVVVVVLAEDGRLLVPFIFVEFDESLMGLACSTILLAMLFICGLSVIDEVIAGVADDEPTLAVTGLGIFMDAVLPWRPVSKLVFSS